MKKILLCLLAVAVNATAQDKIEGTIVAGAGMGVTTPWNADIKLRIPTAVAQVQPYFSMNGITRYTSEMEDNRQYLYTRSQNLYTSQQLLDSRGYDVRYGTKVLFPLQKGAVHLNFEGQHHRQETFGDLSEHFLTAQGNIISNYLWRISKPREDWSQFLAGAGFRHKGFSLSYAYRLRESLNRFTMTQEQGYGVTSFTHNSRNADTRLHNHKVNLQQTFRPAQGHNLAIGAQYQYNKVSRDHSQMLDATDITSEYFRHLYHTESAYAEYRYAGHSLRAFARLQYDFTQMSYLKDGAETTRHLQDFLPQARLDWGIHKGDTLSASYRRLIVRPEIEYLDPMHVRGSHTLFYGNPDLIGIHINNLTLQYKMSRKTVDASIAATCIVVEDGFNAMWIDQNGTRLETWGNIGVRRAASITPSIAWRAARSSLITASINVIWDKRIAAPINLENPHWGFTTQLGLRQQLPAAVSLMLHGRYSQGNTIDVYSHESRNYSAQAQLQKVFKGRYTLALTYRYQQYASAVITKGAYRGNLLTAPADHHTLNLTASFNL